MRGKKLFVASLLMGIGAVFAACPVGAGRAEAAVMVAPNDAHLQYFGRWDKSNAQEYQCAQGLHQGEFHGHEHQGEAARSQ